MRRVATIIFPRWLTVWLGLAWHPLTFTRRDDKKTIVTVFVSSRFTLSETVMFVDLPLSGLLGSCGDVERSLACRTNNVIILRPLDELAAV